VSLQASWDVNSPARLAADPPMPLAAVAAATARPPAPAMVPQIAAALNEQIRAVVAGRPQAISAAVTTLLAGGHLLIEDVPGVGKSVLARGLAATLDGTFRRIQGTADLLPGDVVGSLAPTADGVTLAFRPGPIFANVVMFDELNRANPRAQSALLEALEEGSISVDGTSHCLPSPFIVIATQNPLDMVGTYSLGEGACDRFMSSISLGRAEPEHELSVLVGRSGRAQLGHVQASVPMAALSEARATVDSVYVADAIGAYVVQVLQATRQHPRVRLGVSTRGGVALVQYAKALAAADGRTYVVPHDIVESAPVTLAHRLLLNDARAVASSESRADDRRSLAAGIVAECVASAPAPRR
jgi:MoxR-like ATPase